MRTLYLIGEPGVGKSTLMGALTEGGWGIQKITPVPHVEYTDVIALGLPGRVIQLGKDRGTFSGTDALAMNIQHPAIEYVSQRPADWLLAEGDRLANDAFFEACAGAGQLILVYIDDERKLAAERRAGRGSNQDPTWLAGRITKVKNLTLRHPHHTLLSHDPIGAQVQELRRFISLTEPEFIHA